MRAVARHGVPVDESVVSIGPGLAIALVVLVAVAASVGYLGGLGVGPKQLTAAARAVLQLAVVSLVIATVVRSLPLTAAFVALMFCVAAVTSARRITRDRSGLLAALPIGAGVAPVVAVVLATGSIPIRGIALVPIAGIVIGGAMTATSLAGRRALDELRARRGEYEAGLSLGLTPREITLELCRPSAAQALVPGMDQTRTVGLVTLPGAFVGVLLGGGTPTQAGAAQLLVLISLLAAQATAVLVTIELVARGRLRAPRGLAGPASGPGPVPGGSRITRVRDGWIRRRGQERASQ